MKVLNVENIDIFPIDRIHSTYVTEIILKEL